MTGNGRRSTRATLSAALLLLLYFNSPLPLQDCCESFVSLRHRLRSGSSGNWRLVAVVRQSLGREMLLLWQLLPVLASAAIPEQLESRRRQVWRNGDEANKEAKTEDQRSQETWQALRTNRQKLRELTWERFDEKQKETDGLHEMQVFNWKRIIECGLSFAGPAWLA